MAMNLGFRTKKLFLNQNATTCKINGSFVTNGTYTVASTFTSAGLFDNGASSADSIDEVSYIDLGIVTDERKDLAVGTIDFPIPTGGISNNLTWAIGSKVYRLNISGIIPDGLYVAATQASTTPVPNIPNTDFSSKSNSSVFILKMSKLIGEQNLLNGPATTFGLNLNPCIVYYDPHYISEANNTSTPNLLPKYIITGFSYSFIPGTRCLQYSMSMVLGLNTNMNYTMRSFGDVL